MKTLEELMALVHRVTFKPPSTQFKDDLDAIESALRELIADAERARLDERERCAMEVWHTMMEATADDADDMGLGGWLREAEQRIRLRAVADASKG